LSVQGDFGVFFNEGPKLIHLHLGEMEIPKELVTDLFTMGSRHSQPSSDGIELDLQDAGGSAKPQPLGQHLKSLKNLLLGASKVEEGSPGTAGERFATGAAEKESGFPSASRSVSPVGDHIAQTFLAMAPALGIRTSDAQILRLRTTFFLCSLGHPLLLEERIA